MSNTTYHIRGSCLATATALLLNLPTVGDFNLVELTPVTIVDYEPFTPEASRTIAEAFDTTHRRTDPGALFSLMTEVATRLIRESKPLDPDLARVVDKEFWNLLQ